MRVATKTGYKCDRCGCYISGFVQDVLVVKDSGREICLCYGCYRKLIKEFTKYKASHPEEIVKSDL